MYAFTVCLSMNNLTVKETELSFQIHCKNNFECVRARARVRVCVCVYVYVSEIC
jgi:hypothetical protein